MVKVLRSASLLTAIFLVDTKTAIAIVLVCLCFALDAELDKDAEKK